MSIEVNPVGTHCGLACLYCYQLPVRRGDRNARPAAVDHAAVQVALEAARPGASGFSLFGGEPALASLADLERLWAFGLERYGKNGIQTAGADLSDAHFDLIRRYKVTVGFSIDGPGELNDARRHGTLVQTRAATERSGAALRRCLAEGIPCSLIVTLTTLNASAERLPLLLAWLSDLAAAGLREGRIHSLERDGGADRIALPVEGALAAFRAIHSLERDTALRFDVYADMRKLLMAEDGNGVTCVWEGCDPWTTPAVHGIEADGTRALCQRVNKDGRKWQPLEGGGPLVRQLVLAATPQEQGGCQGCRFLVACKGQCPGTAIGGDWRKRSIDCALWFGLLEDAERDVEASGKVPVSRRPELPVIEARMAAAWRAGVRATVQGCVEDRYRDASSSGSGFEHGDHADHGDHDDLGPAFSLAGGERVDS